MKFSFLLGFFFLPLISFTQDISHEEFLEGRQRHCGEDGQRSSRPNENMTGFISLINQIATTSDVRCEELGIGESRDIRNSSSNSPTSVHMAYKLTRTDANTYRVGLNLNFTQNEEFQNQLPGCLNLLNSGSFNGQNNSQQIEFVQDPSAPHFNIGSQDEGERSHSRSWAIGISCETIIHEVLHVVGLADEYRESQYGYSFLGPFRYENNDTPQIYRFNCRHIGTESSIMANQDSALRLLEQGYTNSILFPHHFNHIISGGCATENQIYNYCSQDRSQEVNNENNLDRSCRRLASSRECYELLFPRYRMEELVRAQIDLGNFEEELLEYGIQAIDELLEYYNENSDQLTKEQLENIFKVMNHGFLKENSNYILPNTYDRFIINLYSRLTTESSSLSTSDLIQALLKRSTSDQLESFFYLDQIPLSDRVVEFKKFISNDPAKIREVSGFFPRLMRDECQGFSCNELLKAFTILRTNSATPNRDELEQNYNFIIQNFTQNLDQLIHPQQFDEVLLHNTDLLDNSEFENLTNRLVELSISTDSLTTLTLFQERNRSELRRLSPELRSRINTVLSQVDYQNQF